MLPEHENHGNDVASCWEVDAGLSCRGEVTFEHLVKESLPAVSTGTFLPSAVCKYFGTALLIVILCPQIWASLDDSRPKPSRWRLPNGDFLFASLFLHLFIGVHSFTQLGTHTSFGLMRTGLILWIIVLYGRYLFSLLKVPPDLSIQNWASRLLGPFRCHHFCFGHRKGSQTGICHFSKDPGSFHWGISRDSTVWVLS